MKRKKNANSLLKLLYNSLTSKSAFVKVDAHLSLKFFLEPLFSFCCTNYSGCLGRRKYLSSHDLINEITVISPVIRPPVFFSFFLYLNGDRSGHSEVILIFFIDIIKAGQIAQLFVCQSSDFLFCETIQLNEQYIVWTSFNNCYMTSNLLLGEVSPPHPRWENWTCVLDKVKEENSVLASMAPK